MLLVDADFLIGLYFDKDIHHETCRRISERVNESMIITWDVIDEAATKLRYYIDKATAIRMIEKIRVENIPIVFADKYLAEETIFLFHLIKTSKLSLTDCMNIAVAKRFGITHILSFDKIYKKNGLKLFN